MHWSRAARILMLSFAVPVALTACGPKPHDSQDGAPVEAPGDAPKSAPGAAAPENLPPGADPEAPPSSAPPPPLAETAPPPPPVAAETFKGDINLAGTEPFWSAEIRAGRITLKRPDQGDMAMPNTGPVITGKSAIWNGGGDAGHMTVVVEKKACNNGMSDKTYPYTASVKVGETVMSGCGTRPK